MPAATSCCARCANSRASPSVWSNRSRSQGCWASASSSTNTGRKEGGCGWWCEGELCGVGLVPLIVDGTGCVIAASAPRPEGAGMLLLTAAARLPLFSDQPELAANRLFANLLDWRRPHRRLRRGRCTCICIRENGHGPPCSLRRASASASTVCTGHYWMPACWPKPPRYGYRRRATRPR